MVIGAIGPWARALIVTVSGLDGDGWFVLLAGVAAAALLYWRRDRITPLIPGVSALMGAIGFAVVVYDGKDIFGDQSSDDALFGDVDLVTPGWGIIMAGVASAGLILASLWLLVAALRGQSGQLVEPAKAVADAESVQTTND
jgi:hypothetical protein